MNGKLEEAFAAAFGSLQDLEVVLAVLSSTEHDYHYLNAKMRVENIYNRLLDVQRETKEGKDNAAVS